MQHGFHECGSRVKSKLIVLMLDFLATKILLLCHMSARGDFVHSTAQMYLGLVVHNSSRISL